MLLALRFLIFDCYVIYSSIYGQYCSHVYQKTGKGVCALTISGYNLKSVKDQSYLNVIDILSLGFTLISICYFIAARKVLYQYENYFKMQNFADDDYSILVENIPPFFFN
jgi:hypothetical protein